MGLMATNQAFEKFESAGTKDKLIVVKLVYVAMQVLALALGVWKVNGMGLLPSVLLVMREGTRANEEQNYEVGLVGLGDCEGAVGSCDTRLLRLYDINGQ